jgi:hypothetical protein
MLAFSTPMAAQPGANLPVKNATLDAVDVGADNPVGRLTGFGPPEPQTHGGIWGHAPSLDFYRVVWFPGDEPFAIVQLTIPPHTVAEKLEIDYLNGISGCFGSELSSTFYVYAANSVDRPWSPIGTVVWDSIACQVGEQERAVTLSIGSGGDLGLGGGSKGKWLFVKFVSAAGLADQPWDFFYIYGEVPIHSVRLIGKVTHNGQ